MAVGYLTSSSLIDTVKREALIPATQSTFTPADFLAFANQEIRISVVPNILLYHEEYFVVDSAAVTIVANQNNYAIPYRAIGGKFREVFYQDTNGNLRSMTRISPDDRPYYQQSNFQTRFVYFYIEGNDVVLMPQVGENPTGSLIFSYFMRPNELVDESRVSTIQSIATDTLAGTTTFTVDQIPSSLTAFIQDGQSVTGFTTSSKLDILQTKPGHKTLAFDVNATNIDSTNMTITFDTDNAEKAVVGDYIAFAGECVIPQIPSDTHDLLAQRVVTRCLAALGDSQGLQNANQKLGEMITNTGSLLDNRSEGQPQKINNLRGLLRSAKIRKRGWM